MPPPAPAPASPCSVPPSPVTERLTRTDLLPSGVDHAVDEPVRADVEVDEGVRVPRHRPDVKPVRLERDGPRHAVLFVGWAMRW